MTEFHHEISNRITAATNNLRAAAEADDPFLVDVHVGELESLGRLAADHGIAVEGLAEILARHGAATPPVGLPISGVIDLRAAAPED